MAIGSSPFGNLPRLGGVLSIAIYCVLSVAIAQENDEVDVVVPDPINQEYATGLVEVDPRTYPGFNVAPIHRAFLPAKVDLSKRFPTPGNQGQLGSCTAWAVGYAARSYYAVNTEKRRRNNPDDIASPAYIYHAIRKAENCDVGSAIPDALNLLKQGVASLRQVPYSDTACRRPNAEQVRMATDFRTKGWRWVDYKDVDNIKGALANGNPVIFGMVLHDKFHQLRGPSIYKSIATDRSKSHAMVVVGYDETRQAFKIINSWGRGWGDRGFGWIDYNILSRESHSAYTIVMEPSPPPKPPEPKPKPEPVVDLSGFECAKLSIETNNSERVILGFVASDSDLAKLKQNFEPHKYRINVDVRPFPQCETLLTLDTQLTAPHGPSIKLTGDGSPLKAGETLSFEVSAPDRPVFLYTNYIQADGSVVTLTQPELIPPTPVEPGRHEIFGDGKEGRSKFTIGPPFGREMIVVLASRSPLFEEPLPDAQTEREYLTAVRRALLYKPDPSLPDREVSAAFLPIVTEEK